MDKNVKAMLKINDVLDDRYKKLCDRYHELELSHNRKKKALILILQKLDDLMKFARPYVVHDVNALCDYKIYSGLRKICDDALFSDGRVKWRIKK